MSSSEPAALGGGRERDGRSAAGAAETWPAADHTAARAAEAERTRSKVLVVDDSELMRAILTDIINSTGDHRVIGESGTGYGAIRLVHELDPDVVTLDLDMPDLGGADALAYIMHESPRPVIMVSSHSAALADPMLRAVDAGALEFVAKPYGDEPRGIEVLRRRLVSALGAASDATISNLRLGRARRAQARAKRAAARLARLAGAPSAVPARQAVVIAASTGGPRALVELIPTLPADLCAAVLVVQHMPSTFTSLLAKRLNELSALPVREAAEGEVLEAGGVYLAPGGYHMGLRRHGEGYAVTLEAGDPVWGVRPAADLLFGAVARHFGPRSVGIVLTGMGRDGAAGLRAIRQVGGWTAIQQIDTAVMPSMPRAAAPYATAELPIEALADALAERLTAASRQAEFG